MSVTLTIRRRCLGKNANGREQFMAKARRVAAERASVHGCALVQLGPDYSKRLRALLPVVVTFVRVGPRLIDTDNLQSLAAAVRDEIATILGITDGPTDARGAWKYDQRKGTYALEVTVSPKAAVERGTHAA
jgi:hypothetical protein